VRIGVIWNFLALVALLCIEHLAIADETFFATTWDTRTALLFRFPESTVQKLLPEGWESAPLKDGTNLEVLFADSVIARYADGKSDGNERVVTWVIP
jgi:hypothetical protein